MAKTNLHPYMSPLVQDFNKKKFLTTSKTLLSFIKSAVLRNMWSYEDDDWIFVSSTKNSLNSVKGDWIPKLYICVKPKDYWNTVYQLIALSKKEPLHWKFCKNFKFFARPDKIVLYGKDLRDVKRLITLVRPVLEGCTFHKMKYAASTKDYGLEKKGKGIYFGADPKFLKEASWRLYRWAVEETLVKQNPKMTADVKRALSKLNIDPRTHGPRSLNTSKSDIEFIKKFWKEINS